MGHWRTAHSSCARSNTWEKRRVTFNLSSVHHLLHRIQTHIIRHITVASACMEIIIEHILVVPVSGVHRLSNN